MSSATDSTPATSPATGLTTSTGPATDSPAEETPVPAGKIGAGVTADEARAVAEAARESGWERPSFAKGLYLGSFDLSLVHPWPTPDPASVERGEAFMARLTEFARTMGARVIARGARTPAHCIWGRAAVGAVGMKIPREYGGLGPSPGYCGRGLALPGSAHPGPGALLSAHESMGVPEPVKVFGTPE